MILEQQIQDHAVLAIEEHPISDVINPIAATKKARFTKRKLLSEIATEHPEEAIKEVFLAFGLDDLSELLGDWMMIALRNSLSAYDEASERADLIDFCQALQKLIEALFVINQNNRATDLQDYLTEEQQQIAATYDQPVLLTSNEKANPGIVLKDFFSRFNLEYIRTELWDLTESTIIYEEVDLSIQTLSKQHILIAHECLLSLVLAGLSYHIGNSTFPQLD